MVTKDSIPTLPLFDRVKENKEVVERIPIEILKETGYKEFLEKCYEFGDFAISEFREYRDKYNQTSDE